MRSPGLFPALALTVALTFPASPAATQGSRDAALDAVLRQQLPRVEALAAEAVVVEAVRVQNARRIPLPSIQAVELSWVGDPQRNPRMRALMNNDCGRRLAQLDSADPLRRESFVMDDQGALVCMSQPTSDYWQGDEEKWTRAFAGGQGAVFIGEPEADESTGAVLIQVSVPVIDGGRAIGVVTVGFDYGEIRRRAASP